MGRLGTEGGTCGCFVGLKTCPHCRASKSRDEFHKNSGRKDGLQVWCKDCYRARERGEYSQRRAELRRLPHNAERIREYFKKNGTAIARKYRMTANGARKTREYLNSDSYKQIQKRWGNSVAGRQSRQTRHERRRAREAGALNTLTITEWREIVASYLSNCVYCGVYCENPTQDHIVPLSKGGTHTADNVVPACKHCNPSKGNKSLLHWMAQKSFQYV